MALINIYQGTVTAGGTDGTQVSTGGTYTAPVDISLDAQVSSDDSELPATDRSVNISVTAKITTAS